MSTNRAAKQQRDNAQRQKELTQQRLEREQEQKRRMEEELAEQRRMEEERTRLQEQRAGRERDVRLRFMTQGYSVGNRVANNITGGRL